MKDLEQILSNVIGAENVVSADQLKDRNPGYCKESLDAAIMVLPRNTEELAAICRVSHENSIPLVSHGGLTGLVDGTASHPGEVIVSFERMNKILRIDPIQGIADVEPGVTLQNLEEALTKHDMIVGVDIPARGSCTIGGMVSTNAGGVRVLKYGMMRQNVLGLEVVLADGKILEMISPLMKNNAGYDMKQNFIGSEGTLGLVSRIVLKLWPAPKATSCALAACEGIPQLSELFTEARRILGGDLLSFEAMWPEYYRLTTSQPGFGTPPLGPDFGIYSVIEVSGDSDDTAQEALMSLVEPAFENGLVSDAVVAQSEGERASIWRAREDSDAIEHGYEANLSYDIGLELKFMDSFAITLIERFKFEFPDTTPYIFGHVGDGNLHVMFGLTEEQAQNRKVYDDLLYNTVSEFEGSTISAEHGIGLEKKDYLNQSITPQTLEAMKLFKSTFDPKNILNPGKIFEL